MATPPQLTPEQRAEALKKAKIARTKRAELRKEITNGKKISAVLKKANDPIIGRMKVKTLLEAVPGCGSVKTAKIMADLKIADNRRVQGLGVRQVEGLVKIFG
ncbi:MAG: integration host factor, actinobacterial type [Coriobacteriia bacterium]|nr:integration host factor, actinobacterial type [Coriobacteriia bacterium]